MAKVTLIATSTFGLEAVVKRELQGLGVNEFNVADGKVEFEAALDDIPRLNLWLRTADRVLLKLAEFKALDFDQLFDQAKIIPWENWITKDGKITVVGKSVRSKLASVRANQSIVKKAVVERLKQKFHTEWLAETGAEFTVQIALLKDVAQITLDTSGQGLHKRGYRAQTGEVPLRENLAAALVLLSFWERERILIDPMCGSGTILIEAAMIGRNMAPGLRRNFASENWPSLSRQSWKEARQAAENEVTPAGDLKIFGYDFDRARIRDSRTNAKKAGVEKDIIFKEQELSKLRLNDPYGIVISNPPYGMKLGNAQDLVPLYSSINRLFKDQKGWSVYLLTADKEFPRHFQRGRPDKVRKLFNGTIEVQYYQYYGDRPPKTMDLLE